MTESPQPRWPWRRIHPAIATAIFVGVVWLLLATSSDLGYARDEGFYFHAARVYEHWFSQLWSDRGAATAKEAVDASWSTNHEHPGLMKSLFALSHLVLEKKFDLFRESGTSFRFPTMVLSGAAAAALYLWGARLHGALAGLVAAGLFVFMPRVFYHAHLACFDLPITALFLLCAFAYLKSLETAGVGWPIVTALLFGLALDTKHNSWFLPIAFGAHALILGVWALVADRYVWSVIGRSVGTIVAMAIIGPLVMYALWPWIWFDTLDRLQEYALFHLNHDYYNMEYLGENYWSPPMPRTYAWGMTIATVPIVTLALFVVGLGRETRGVVSAVRMREREGPERFSTPLLWLLCIGVSYGAWLSSSTPIFGGTKHWMTAYPFLALFAASGFVSVQRAIAQIVPRAGAGRMTTALSAGAAALVLAAPVVQTIHAHPFALSAYSPLVGGAPGAATLGLNRTFWGYTTGSVVEYLNREVPKNGRVYIHDTALPAWDMLKEDGRVRKDIRAVWLASDADFAIYHHEMHMQGQEYQAWVAYGTVAPDVIAGLDGVPVVWIYRRPR